MNSKRLTPVEVVVTEMGGVRKAAKAVNCQPSMISSWRKARKFLPSGTVPIAYAIKFLVLAKAEDINITAEELLLGRELGE